jgi:hypothetical protein
MRLVVRAAAHSTNRKVLGMDSDLFRNLDLTDQVSSLVVVSLTLVIGSTRVQDKEQFVTQLRHDAAFLW